MTEEEKLKVLEAIDSFFMDNTFDVSEEEYSKIIHDLHYPNKKTE